MEYADLKMFSATPVSAKLTGSGHSDDKYYNQRCSNNIKSVG